MCCSESHFPAWQTFTYLVIRIIDIGCNARSTLIRENFPGKLFRRAWRQCCIRAQIYPHQQRCYYGSRQYGALVLHIVHELNSGHCCRCSQHNRPDQTGNWRNNWPAFTIAASRWGLFLRNQPYSPHMRHCQILFRYVRRRIYERVQCHKIHGSCLKE